MTKDFTVAWQAPIGEQDWKGFLASSFNEPDRVFACDKIERWIHGRGCPRVRPLSLAEAGFGQCHDFQTFFKKLHDTGTIKYYGFDVTKQFVDYATKTHPGYDFKTEDFFASESPQFDIIYSRGVLEHQAPDRCYVAFENLLKRTKYLSVVSWFLTPGVEYLRWIPTDGLANAGAYASHFSSAKLAEIIGRQDFRLETTTLGGKNTNYVIYVMTRNL